MIKKTLLVTILCLSVLLCGCSVVSLPMNKREKGTSYESYIIKLPQEYFLTKSGSGPYLIHRIGPSDRIKYKSIITYDSNDQLLENVEKVGYDHRFIIIKGKKMMSDTFTSHKPYGDGYGIINVQTGRR